MKKIIALFAFVLIAGAVSAQESTEQTGAEIVFAETLHDFGDITQGDKVTHVFAFENTGTEPLVLNNVLTTCGCTAPSWPRDPIAPGESGEITVTFNSRGKIGMQNKIITVVSNAVNNQERVNIRANVLPGNNEGN